MSTNKVTIKKNAQSIKEFASNSAQHCFFIGHLCELCKIRLDKENKSQLNELNKYYNEVKMKCENIFASNQDNEKIDIAILRKLIADYNKHSISFINYLNNMLAINKYSKIHPYILHMISEEKLHLESMYTFAIAN